MNAVLKPDRSKAQKEARARQLVVDHSQLNSMRSGKDGFAAIPPD
jgi:hypothetical protein